VYFGEPFHLASLLKAVGKRDELKWIQCSFAGVDKLVQKDMPRGYILTKMVFPPLIT
jgi:hypothetical protein